MKNKLLPTIAVLSYNLRFHMSYEEAFEVAHVYNFDIVCLQECYRELLPAREGEFTLAGKTNNGVLGLAIYYRTSRFKVVSTARTVLKTSVYEKVYSQANERIIVAKLHDLRANKDIFVASFHAIHLVASNYLRRLQVAEAIRFLNKHNPPKDEIPTIVVGDYNYPWFHRRLKKLVAMHEYTLFISKEPTFKNSVLKGKFDLVSARHISNVELSVLPQGRSDHLPLRVDITY